MIKKFINSLDFLTKTHLILWSKLRGGVSRDVLYSQELDLAWLQPSEDGLIDIQHFYADEYRKNYFNLDKLDLKENHARMKGLQKFRVNWLKKFIGDNDSLLELGCSSGYFLEEIQPYVLEATGLELNDHEAAYGRSLGLSIVTGVPEAISAKFSHLCIFQVLEHQQDPVEFIREITSKLLKPNGIIHIEVPTLNNPLIRLFHISEFRDFWFQEPHLFYFSKVSLVAILESAGFKVLDVSLRQSAGLINHLNWMLAGKPMMNRKAVVSALPDFDFAADLELASQNSLNVSEFFERINGEYIELLESIGYGDVLTLSAVKSS